MSTKHKSPYKRGNSAKLFDFFRSKQVVTRDEMIEFAKTLVGRDGEPLSDTKATLSSLIVLSPRPMAKDADVTGDVIPSEGSHRDCRGYVAAMGHVYYAERLKRDKSKGEPKKYRLRWRSEVLPVLTAKETVKAEVSSKTEIEKEVVSEKVEA
jgi:hypothetical protein